MTQLKIDENLIKVSGRFPVSFPLELGEDIEIKIKANCVKKEIYDNQDGTINVCYIIKPLDIEKL